METMHIESENPSYANSYNIVAFQLDKQTFALPLETVVQIIPMLKLTPLPHTHPAITGVMNFRGSAVPVINMRLYLGMEMQALQLHTPILLVRLNWSGNAKTVGLIVDEVQDVVNIPENQIIQLKDMMPSGLGGVPILRGMLHTQEGATLLIDLEHLFSNGPLQTIDLINPGGNGSAALHEEELVSDQAQTQPMAAVQES